MKHRFRNWLAICVAAGLLGAARDARGQVTVASGYTPPDDTPKINVGITIFANYSYQDEPQVVDGSPQHNSIHVNSFDVTRAYINVTGSLSHWFSFRITPDITRETGTGSSLSGSQTFRLKYAYGQVNFDDFLPRGSWLRIGMQQTPWIDFQEGVYRYRFQGTIFTDREGFLTSSDYAISTRVAFPENYGDVHVGIYNGDGYSSTNDQRGINDQKAFQARVSIRPAPGIAVLRGLRLTGFYDSDHYFKDSKKERAIGALTFEHAYVNAGAEYLSAKDQSGGAAVAELRREGYSVWVTPRTPFGIEALLRYDDLTTNKDISPKPKRQRTIAGIAYWPELAGGKSVAFLVDYEILKIKNVTPVPADTKTWALHTLWSF
jgi:hypothetical protein